MDTFSYSINDPTGTASISSVSIGVDICGPRTYTLGGAYVDSTTTPWLLFDTDNGILTAYTDSD